MKVGELREKIKTRKKDELQQLIVEMYKQMPKKMRENKEIDRLIDDPDAFKKQKKSKKQLPENLDFELVAHETKRFIADARAQYYIAPNRIVPKKERANWRFTAKRLINEVANQEEHKEACANLLTELYKLFAYASEHYVFASDEPFYTLKISQPEFLERVVLLKSEFEDPEKWMTDSLKLVLESGVDRNTLTRSLLEALLGTLKNAPLKERMVQISKNLLHEKQQQVRGASKRRTGRYGNSLDYKDKGYINNLIEMIFITESALGEFDAAINFFNRNYQSSTKEVKLFVLLQMILSHQRKEEWIKTYEAAVAKGIKPRVGLQKTYKYIKEKNEMPDHIVW